MQLGNVILIECPECGKNLKNIHVVSANSFGGRFFSDGNFYAPMYPKPINITRCSSCQAIFWVQEARIVGEQITRPELVDNNKVGEICHLNLDDYFRALNMGMAAKDIEKEFYLRKQIWHKQNELITKKELSQESELYKENAQKLEVLLNEGNPDERLMIAEINRNTGNFRKCLRLLEQKFPDEYLQTVRKMRKKALTRQSKTFEL